MIVIRIMIIKITASIDNDALAWQSSLPARPRAGSCSVEQFFGLSLGLRLQGIGFRVRGLGFGVEGLGYL